MKKILTMIGIVIVLIFVINESRFLVWGGYGLPEQLSSPNCGEQRLQYNVTINSKQDYLNLFDKFQTTSSRDAGQEAFPMIQWFRGNYTLDDISVRESGSLLFQEKIYSVPGARYCSMHLEITENGLMRTIGCCGI